MLANKCVNFLLSVLSPSPVFVVLRVMCVVTCALHVCVAKVCVCLLQTCMLQPCVCYRRVCYSHVCVTDVPGSVGVVSASPGLRRKLRRCDVLGPGGDSVEPAPLPVVQLTKPLLYSPSLQRKVVSSSTLSSRSTCSSVTDSSSDDSRLSKAVASSQRTETDDSDSVSENVRDRDDSGVTTDDSHDTETEHSRQPRYV